MSHDRIRDGYRLALREAGVPLDPALEYEAHRHHDPMDGAAEAWEAMASPPTACLVPNAPDAANLRAALDRVGMPLPLDALAIVDHVYGSRQHGLREAPAARTPMDDFARATLLLASQVVDGSWPAGVRLSLPFSTSNLSLTDEPER